MFSKISNIFTGVAVYTGIHHIIKIDMSKYVMSKHVITKINISDLTTIKTITDDTWNKVTNGDYTVDYFYNEKKIGYIRYRIGIGQIGLISLDPEYRNQKIGKLMLDKAIIDIKNNNIKEVWAVTTKDHPFWSNVYNRSFTYREPAHFTIKGNVYFMKL